MRAQSKSQERRFSVQKDPKKRAWKGKRHESAVHYDRKRIKSQEKEDLDYEYKNIATV